MTNPDTRMSRRDRRGTWWTLKRRRWAYSIAAAAVPVAVTFGLLSGEQLAALLGLAGAVLGVTGLALANPTDD